MNTVEESVFFVSDENQFARSQNQNHFHNRRQPPLPPQGQPQPVQCKVFSISFFFEVLCIVFLNLYTSRNPFLPLYADPWQHQVQATLMPRPANTSFQVTFPVNGHAASIHCHVNGHGASIHGHGPYNNISSGPVNGHRHGPYNNISSGPGPRTFHPAPRPRIIRPPLRIFRPRSHRYESERPRLPPTPYHHQQTETPSTTTNRVALSLETMIRWRVEYWFSSENLSRDDFLKSEMDEEGWVPISHIITFPSVSIITKYIVPF